MFVVLLSKILAYNRQYCSISTKFYKSSEHSRRCSISITKNSEIITIQLYLLKYITIKYLPYQYKELQPPFLLILQTQIQILVRKTWIRISQHLGFWFIEHYNSRVTICTSENIICISEVINIDCIKLQGPILK